LGTSKPMKTRLFTLLSCIILFQPGHSIWAQDANTTYSFLRLDNGARSAAMAGSFVSITDDPSVIFYNPAGLGTLTSGQASFGFLKHLLDINSGYAAYGQQYRDWGWFGAGISYINYGSFTRTNDVGTILGTFHASEFAVLGGYSNLVYNVIHYGVNLKFIYSSIADDQSAALAVDVGGMYVIEEQQIAIGVSLLNLGRQISAYVDTLEALPLDLKIGISKRLEHLPLLISLDFHRLNESAEDFLSRFRAFSVGGEFAASEAFKLRFGYNNLLRNDLKIGTSAGLAGFSLGAGIFLDRYEIDYAFSSLGKVGSLHRVSVGLNL
jgi:hypothetical protein